MDIEISMSMPLYINIIDKLKTNYKKQIHENNLHII